MSAFEVRPATPEDSAGIRRLLTRVFEKEVTAEQWAWKFERNPDGGFGTIALAQGEVIGNYAGWGLSLLLDGQPRLTYSVGDVATDPAVRGLGGRRGAYVATARTFYELVADRVPFCFGFPNPRALEISNRLAGTRTLLPIRQVVVEADSFPAAPAGARAGDFVEEPFDLLWEAASRFLTHAPVRDRARVNWRFHARPDRYYRMVWVEEAGRMRSWAALSVGGESATVADFLGSEPDGRDLPALFAAAAGEARRMGARRLVFWETPGGPGRDFIAKFRGERLDAGFPMIARVFDEGVVERFARGAHLVPSLFDFV